MYPLPLEDLPEQPLLLYSCTLDAHVSAYFVASSPTMYEFQGLPFVASYFLSKRFDSPFISCLGLEFLDW